MPKFNVTIIFNKPGDFDLYAEGKDDDNHLDVTIEADDYIHAEQLLRERYPDAYRIRIPFRYQKSEYKDIIEK